MSSSFLSGIGKALRAPGLGDRLQAALPAAGGDTGAVMRLRALQMQLAEYQRRNEARDARVIGARNLGFGNNDWQVRAAPQAAALSGGQRDLPIGAMSGEDLSWAARQRIAPGSAQPPIAGDDSSGALDRTTAIQHAAAAILRGADPDAVRARLHEMLQPPQFLSESPSEGPPSASTFSHMAGANPPDGFWQQPDFPLQARSEKRRLLPALKSGGDMKLDPPISPSNRGGRLNNEGDGLESAGNRVRPNQTHRAGGSNGDGGLNGYGYRPQGGDAQLLARAIYAESGTTPEDMLAIGWSMVNRIGFVRQGRRPAFGATLAEVLTQPAANGLYQYSIMNNGGSPEWRQSANPSAIPATGRASWSRALAIANAILSGRVPDPSAGAQYFFASSSYDPRDIRTARSDFRQMLAQHHYVPSPYQSASTLREDGRPRRNYLFRETPVKTWLPDEWFPEFHRRRR